ncbi:WD40 repeat domain-containing protein [Tautonia sociabilis]|uniref:WD40 repeat domain-containing protein n=1 Tax=Tautonia sociabilis TaxID=2080755 RepID=UPI0013155472|nr:hypothetical protein [Tautonia sociabilis]
MALIGSLAGCGRPVEPIDPVAAIDAAAAGEEAVLATDRPTALIAESVPEIRAVLPTAPQPSSLAVSADGRLLAVGDKRGVALWDLEPPAHRATLQGQPALVSAVAFDPSGRTLATVGYESSPEFAAVLMRWDTGALGTGRVVLKSPDQIATMRFSPDGSTLVLGTEDEEDAGRVAFLDVESGELEVLGATLKTTVSRLAVAPAGDRVAASSWRTVNYSDQGELVLFDSSSKEEVARPGSGIGRINDLAFSPDGTTLAVACQRPGGEWTVLRFDAATGAAREPVDTPSVEVSSLAFSPDGSLLAMGAHDGAIRLLELGSGAMLQGPSYHRGAAVLLAFSPDGRTLLSAALDRQVALWDVPLLQKTGRAGASAAGKE